MCSMFEFQNEGVYCIVNTVTKDLYIGSSCNLGCRKSKHFSKMKNNKHDNHLLQQDANKYGIECFEFKILEFCKENFLEKEEFYVKLYNPKYNLIKEIVNKKMSLDSRKKMSETRKKLFAEGKLKTNCAKRIVQTDLEGNIIAVFNSVKKASLALGVHETSIQRVLYGKYKQNKGFKFMYETDLLKPI